ncbi:MAG TPA: hypothetical protein VF588_03115 [Pyrinomonadaceae bacterium]|jgi:hypothetical protein
MTGTRPRQDEALDAALRHPFFGALFNRRSRRISLGVQSVPAGSLSYTSEQKPQPLDPLEEALLIAATGTTGVTMPDMPFTSEDGKPLVGSPMLEVNGRAASSPDNAQAAHFFMINDSGTYFLRAPEGVDPYHFREGVTPEKLIAHAEACKVKVLDGRLEFPRVYPCYIGRNKYVSNLPGTTLFVPVLDLTKQYINGLMFLLSQPDGYRPAFLDDWNFYRWAGVRKWVRSGFLNKDLPIPLGYMNTFRIHVEADLLVQNLLLTIQAMGLGGWVHAAFVGPLLLGDEEYAQKYGPGLGFRFVKARRFKRLTRFMVPPPAWRDNPVGKDGLIEGHCPPYFKSMDDAVDDLLKHKYGPGGLYKDPRHLARVFKPGLAERFVEEVPHYSEEVVACVKDICNYIYDTYGRFPAHVDAMHVPGVWVQAHHTDLKYYDQFYDGGYSETQRTHQQLWHGAG